MATTAGPDGVRRTCTSPNEFRAPAEAILRARSGAIHGNDASEAMVSERIPLPGTSLALVRATDLLRDVLAGVNVADDSEGSDTVVGVFSSWFPQAKSKAPKKITVASGPASRKIMLLRCASAAIVADSGSASGTARRDRTKLSSKIIFAAAAVRGLFSGRLASRA